MSEIKFDCSHCGHSFAVDDDMLGETITCPACENEIELEGPDTKVCPYCAEEVKFEALKCKHCGSMLDGCAAPQPASPAQSNQQMLVQDRMNLIPGENILVEGLSTYIKSAMNCIPCHAYLTNYRLVVCNKGMAGAAAVFNVIGAVAALARKPTKITFQVPLSQIASVVKGKHGFATKYTVATAQGQRYNVQFTKGDRWEAAMLSQGVRVTK